MPIFYVPNIETEHCLDEKESKHAVKVLRLEKGDKLDIIDGAGTFYTCEIDDANPKKCSFYILNSTKEQSPSVKIHLAIAPTKNLDRIEWLVEKCVEVGIHEFSFFKSFHSERKVLRIDRLQRIAVSALKQSQKSTLPKINELTNYEEFVANRSEDILLIANQHHGAAAISSFSPEKKSVCVLIGPEGDFSETEIERALQHNFKPITLGRSRLRTETAALSACVELNLFNR